MQSVHVQPQKDQDGTDSENFPSDSSKEEVKKSVEIDENELVLMLHDQADSAFADVHSKMEETDRDGKVSQESQELQVEAGAPV